MPQIEVMFDIDANGILNVSAKDKATSTSQSIVIKAKGGLSDDEIEKMVQDAEKHAETDKQFQELVNSCNEAEQLIHATRKAVKEAADKLTDDEKGLEDACAKLEEAVKEKDINKINTEKETLNQANAQLAQKLYSAPDSSRKSWH